MKKQILTILLSCFVGAVASETVRGNGIAVVGNIDLSCDEYSPDFVLSTQGYPAVNGLKIYAYFANTEDNYPALTSYSLEGGNVTFEEMNSRVFRAVIDYSKATIPANSVFPPQTVKPKVPARHFKYFSVTWLPPFKGVGCWNGYPYEKNFHNIVIESKGKVIFGKHPDFKSRVGVLGSGCPGGANWQGSVIIGLDTEDKNDASGIVAGDASFPYVIFDDGKSVFKYCAVEYSKMPRVPYDYAVLQLDNACPEGTYPFTRHHDTEDSNNKNFSGGFIWHNVVKRGGNADLKYCFVPADKSSKLKYPLGEDSKFGVFANYSSSKIVHSEIKIDDEDSNNSNSWHIPQAGLVLKDEPTKPLALRIWNIISGSDNTRYHVIRLKNSALRKNSVAENSDVVTSPFVTAAPFAPAIKGLNRDVVAVELKSAGDVKVSIVGVNGAVIANIAEKNLQAGVHQIKWNAGMAPNGRYVVKVEQNGMVDAKNVILK